LPDTSGTAAGIVRAMSDLIVYGGWQAFGVGDFSPFCLKLKTYLRMIDVPYTAKLGDPRTAPTKKIPFINDGGTVLGDSGVIVEYLKKKHGDSLDANLTADQHALGHLVRRTLEESLYWPTVYSRWIEDENWPEVKKHLLPVMPPVIGGLIAEGPIRGGVRKQLFEQGTGRHPRDVIYANGCADLDTLAIILADRQFLHGDQPTSYDAILFGFLANVAAFPASSPLMARLKSKANLSGFLDRMKAKYWATLDKW
jgi:glutathione S-transferase